MWWGLSSSIQSIHSFIQKMLQFVANYDELAVDQKVHARYRGSFYNAKIERIHRGENGDTKVDIYYDDDDRRRNVPMTDVRFLERKVDVLDPNGTLVTHARMIYSSFCDNEFADSLQWFQGMGGGSDEQCTCERNMSISFENPITLGKIMFFGKQHFKMTVNFDSGKSRRLTRHVLYPLKNVRSIDFNNWRYSESSVPQFFVYVQSKLPTQLQGFEDATFRFDNMEQEDFKVHRYPLIKESEYFASLFRAHADLSQPIETKFSPVAFKFVVNHMYKPDNSLDFVDFDSKQLFSIYQTAHEIMYEPVLSMLREHIQNDNMLILDFLAFPNIHLFPTLNKMCIEKVSSKIIFPAQWINSFVELPKPTRKRILEGKTEHDPKRQRTS